MSRLLALTAEQREAVETPDGPHVLVAPPGSGKTEVVVQRTIRLLEQSPEELFRVLAITYTTKAADELRTRVRDALGDESWRVSAMTLHAFCLDMLTHYGEPVGVGSDVSVYDDELRVYAFLDGLRDAGLAPADAEAPPDERTVKGCLASIDRLRIDLVPPDLAPDSAGLPGVLLSEAYDAYDRALEAANALDFSAMLFKAHQLLAVDPWVARHYQRLYRHVLVDEAHDLNQVQYEILCALFRDGSRNIFLVADDDQEILTFTGASSKYVRRFAEEFAARQLQLSTNFRCAGAIIEAAERLRGHFDSGRPARPQMVAGTPAPGWVRAWTLEDEPAEAAAVADWTQQLLTTGLPGDWLHEGEDPSLEAERVGIIGRTRYAFDHLVAELDTRELPYVLRAGEGGLFDSSVGRAAYFALRVVANPRDRVSRRRLAAHVQAATSTAEIASEARATFAMADDEVGEFFRDLAGQPAFPEALARLLAAAATAPVEDLVYQLLELDVGVPGTQALTDGVDPPAAEPGVDLWRRDRGRLLGVWKDYAAVTDPSERGLSGFLRHVARMQRTTAADPGIRMLTPHSAKGMQFRVVAVLGANEGTFPFYRALQEGKLDEERRAMYVAVTRAERGLLLTRPHSRVTSWGNVRADPASRFIDELGLQAQRR
jgi:DNA helicase-2/ATP-dependent DNA helicase PcrA